MTTTSRKTAEIITPGFAVDIITRSTGQSSSRQRCAIVLPGRQLNKMSSDRGRMPLDYFEPELIIAL